MKKSIEARLERLERKLEAGQVYVLTFENGVYQGLEQDMTQAEFDRWLKDEDVVFVVKKRSESDE